MFERGESYEYSKCFLSIPIFSKPLYLYSLIVHSQYTVLNINDKPYGAPIVIIKNNKNIGSWEKNITLIKFAVPKMKATTNSIFSITYEDFTNQP